MFALINPVPKFGDPFQEARIAGLKFYNNTGGTISRGQVAAIDMASTTGNFQNLISTGANATSAKWPLVIALADVAGSITSAAFSPMGLVPALATSTTAKGAMLQPGTANSTGGNILIAASTASGQPAPCGFWASNSTSDGTTPDLVVFSGIHRGALAGVGGTSGIG